MKPSVPFLVLVVVAFTLCPSGGIASNVLGAEPVDYVRQVKPLLEKHCYECHGPDRQESELRLDTVAFALEGGNLGAVVEPGKSGESLLLAAVQGVSDDVQRMPPEDEAEALPAAAIALLKRWIDGGAQRPDDEKPAASKQSASRHWSFQPLQRPAPPTSNDRWVRNAIDAFILAKLQQTGLRPSADAARHVLLRRLHLDLTGLPPTEQELDRYMRDKRPDAYERLVDRLLASPQYGERWGRHWLDAARYADSDGYTNDVARVMWRYRDWVVDAVNRDQPFDEFVLDQVAGDLRPSASHEQLVATGFHRNTQRNREGGSDAEQYRVEAVIDRVSTTGVVFLGLTLGCARCHDHKYDPISQRDFYQLFAFLNNQDEPKVASPLDGPERVQLAQRMSQRKELEGELAKLDKQLSTQQQQWELDAKQASATASWRVLMISKADSLGGATLSRKDDGSVLTSGRLPKTDTFVIEAPNPLQKITGLRLEVLTHESLPGGGPGLASNGNFLLHEIELETADAGDFVRTPLVAAEADHSQPKYSIGDAIDGDAKTGWAINVNGKGDLHANRTAVLRLKEAVAVSRLRIRLIQNQDTYLVGRFRLAVTDAAPDVVRIESNAIRKALSTEVKSRTDAQRKLLKSTFATRFPERKQLADQIARLKKQEDVLRKRSSTTALVMRERGTLRDSYIHIRGDFLRKGKPVQPQTPAVLPPLETENELPNRLDLARWLVSAQQPLTPRVTVNRVWQQMFGVGIVETENDFGLQGARPSHPKLLDWLAADFVQGGWSLKRLHRRIVTSSTYRQSSDERPELTEIDAGNRLLARQNRLRLEAESIRDTSLFVSGLLSTKLKGPSVFPPQPAGVMKMTRNPNRKWNVSRGEDRYRRGMYTYFWRSTPHPFLKLFNAPETNTTCTRRDRSNTPLQALTLLNDEAFVEAAYALGGRILREPGGAKRRIELACQLCLNRLPSDDERTALGGADRSRKSGLRRSVGRSAGSIPAVAAQRRRRSGCGRLGRCVARLAKPGRVHYSRVRNTESCRLRLSTFSDDASSCTTAEQGSAPLRSATCWQGTARCEHNNRQLSIHLPLSSPTILLKPKP